MSGYIVSPKADEDIFEVWRYLDARACIEVANRVEAEIYDAFETLAKNPRLGHKRSDLTFHPVLFFSVYSYNQRTSNAYNEQTGHPKGAVNLGGSSSTLN